MRLLASLGAALALFAIATPPAAAQATTDYRVGEMMQVRTMICMNRADVDDFVRNSNEFGTYVAISLINQDTCGVMQARIAHGAVYQTFASRVSADPRAPQGCTTLRWNLVTVYGRDGRGRPAYALENTGAPVECVAPAPSQQASLR